MTYTEENNEHFGSVDAIKWITVNYSKADRWPKMTFLVTLWNLWVYKLSWNSVPEPHSGCIYIVVLAPTDNGKMAFPYCIAVRRFPVKILVGFFLCGVCMFSTCICCFFMGTLTPHSPETYMINKRFWIDCRCGSVCADVFHGCLCVGPEMDWWRVSVYPMSLPVTAGIGSSTLAKLSEYRK